MSIASPPTSFQWVILPLKMPRICTSLNDDTGLFWLTINTNASRAKGCKPVLRHWPRPIAFEQWKAGRQNKIGITVKDILIGFNGSLVFKVVFRADIIRKARKRIKAEAYNGKPAVAPSSRGQFWVSKVSVHRAARLVCCPMCAPDNRGNKDIHCSRERDTSRHKDVTDIRHSSRKTAGKSPADYDKSSPHRRVALPNAHRHTPMQNRAASQPG